MTFWFGLTENKMLYSGHGRGVGADRQDVLVFLMATLAAVVVHHDGFAFQVETRMNEIHVGAEGKIRNLVDDPAFQSDHILTFQHELSAVHLAIDGRDGEDLLRDLDHMLAVLIIVVVLVLVVVGVIVMVEVLGVVVDRHEVHGGIARVQRRVDGSRHRVLHHEMIVHHGRSGHLHLTTVVDPTVVVGKSGHLHMTTVVDETVVVGRSDHLHLTSVVGPTAVVHHGRSGHLHLTTVVNPTVVNRAVGNISHLAIKYLPRFLVFS